MLLLLSLADRNRVVQAFGELAGEAALLLLFLPLQQPANVLHSIHLTLRLVGGQIFGHVLAEGTGVLLGLMGAVRTESWTPNCREGGCCLALGCSRLGLEGTI